MKFMINSKEKPINHPINVVHTDLDSFILYSDIKSVDDESQFVDISKVPRVVSSMQIVIIDEGKEMDEECL